MGSTTPKPDCSNARITLQSLKTAAVKPRASQSATPTSGNADVRPEDL
eukprot:CAMPEP_0195057818 /NCGR_PEP_ID=MMETSP0448-20130528/5851_1 /TAXON_ID=66468 /ORGANISM="Heterocapsa triquestra, Strain CCMP 448" /LENGTH=47 /DNA_ID= /DNA_START= /DNA_END= /DNA_ORIENTATION=